MNKTQLGYSSLSDDLHTRVFGHSRREVVSERKLNTVKSYLGRFGITVPVEDNGSAYTGDLPLPPLKGANLKEHFEEIARDQIGHYMDWGDEISTVPVLQVPPREKIVYSPGWHRYEKLSDGEWDIRPVPYPLEDAFCYDTETFVVGGNFPIIGTALSASAYYLWLASELLDPELPKEEWDQYGMIPVGRGRFIFGHNISFDRIRTKEAYNLEPGGPESFFFDTLSAHVGVSGLASGQRWLYALAGKDPAELTEKERRELQRKPRWFSKGSTNSLVACYNFHVANGGGFFEDAKKPLDEGDKKIREIFVKATDLCQIKDLIEDCVEYALKDVFYTFELFQALWPKYKNSTPSLVGFCGHYHLNGGIIPLAENWEEWIANVEKVFEEHIQEMTSLCKEMMWELLYSWVDGDDDKKAEVLSDPWYSQLNWEVKTVKGKYANIPTWARPFIKDPDEEIGVRSRLAHILLRLEWENSPIRWTPGDGWTYTGENGKVTKVPHPKGTGDNVGGLLSKDFVKDMEVGRLSSSLPEAQRALDIANAISYWTSVRGRILSRLPIQVENPYGKDCLLILPEILAHGTLTRRTVENLMITLTSTKGWRIGTELKTRITAPDGWKVVGADYDGQEMQIAGMYADRWDHGIVGSSPIGYRVLSGEKAMGTDPHTALAREVTPEVFKGVVWDKDLGVCQTDSQESFSPVDKKRAKELDLARDLAKIVGFSILYGSGAKGVKDYIRKFYPDKSQAEVAKFARNAIEAKKGFREDGIFVGGSDSGAFNQMEEISLRSRIPQLPVLGTKISTALRPDAVGTDFANSRTNWSIQASGAECLAIFLTAIHWLGAEFKIPFRFVLSIHDEIWCITPEKYAEQFAVLYQMAHVYNWALFHHRLGMEELPLSRAFFSGVAIDDRLRKKTNECTVSPSNPNGSEEPDGKEWTMSALAEAGAVSKLTTRYNMITRGVL
ncbi:DNA polymerase gamma [Synechococcus phage S-CBWM1]|uniref:Mitochondrial DNA polymerase catalytic subunit n=1 Tax=Synechococcus phage S-CBWM1 TaxID=2053653 RepID=A0A3G1L3K3_9CAUD|nr:DNA polymerase [Synechococcus phage S-CBWM1]ATW62761.1 DNA polymerase gamma [Synechococcus phage S-CBWM1]